ncbi:MAG: hypothetical protein KKD44_21440 [Proteobacteria bacterium]|nr:hypothetical protein [Pseudomonadota bacterium]
MKGLKQKSTQINHFYRYIIGLFFLALVLFPVKSFAFGSWNQETTARELCFLFTLSKDWQQTLDISKNPEKYSEANPFLGAHPDQGKVHTYFAGCAIAHALVAYMLPPRYSKLWQVTWIGIQSSVTEHNNNNGLDQEMGMEYMISFSIPF